MEQFTFMRLGEEPVVSNYWYSTGKEESNVIQMGFLDRIVEPRALAVMSMDFPMDPSNQRFC